MKLYYARHGQTDTGQTLDQPLNDVGIQQAHKLAEQLKDIKFDAIISSPLKRAYQTAEIVNKYHSLPIQVDHMWRERDVDAYADASLWNDLFDFDKNISINNIEPLDVFFKRIYVALEELKSSYQGETVLVVAHGGVQHAVNAYANNLPLEGNMRIHPMKNCEYRVFELN